MQVLVKKELLSLFIVLLLILWGAYVLCPGYFLSGHKQLLSFYENINSGEHKAAIFKKYHTGEYNYLNLSTDTTIYDFNYNSSEWIIHTPSRLSREWILIMKFNEDILISADIFFNDFPLIVPANVPSK